MPETGKRILLVESCSKGMSGTFAQFVFGAGGAVRMNLTGNLAEAERRFRREGGFGLILLSMHLPDCAGIAALRKALDFAGDTPVAILIGDNDQHLADEARGLGAVGVYVYAKVPVNEVIDLCRASAPVAAKPVASTIPAETPCFQSAAEPVAQPQATESLVAAAPCALTPTISAEPVAPVEPAVVYLEPAEPEDLNAPVELDEATAAVEIVEAGGAGEVAEVLCAVEPPVAAPVLALCPEPEPVQPEPPVVQPQEPVAPAQSAVVAPEGTPAAGMSPAAAEELLTLRALRHELEGAVRALEERCRELEAGQTALIEAEHVAIEREKAARLAAEARVTELEKMNADLREKAESTVGLAEVERQRSALQLALEEAERRERAERARAIEETARRAEELQGRLAASEKQLKEAQWQLSEVREERDQSVERARELELAAGQVARREKELDELRAQLEEAQQRTRRLEHKLAQARLETDGAFKRVGELEGLAHRLHALADRADEAERLGQTLQQLRAELHEEREVRGRIVTELHKAQSREEKTAALEKTLKENTWLLHKAEEEAVNAKARADELAVCGNGREQKLASEIEILKRRVIELEKEKNVFEKGRAEADREKADFARQQLARLEELTALYERAQLERLELSGRLARYEGGGIVRPAPGPVPETRKSDRPASRQKRK